MPRGYRYVILAAFGWLSLAAANDSDPVAPRQQASAQQSIAESLANIAATDRDQAERAKSSKEAEPCEKGDDRRYSDLCAQWKAADAAVLAAWLSGASFAAVLVALALAYQANSISRESARTQNRAYIYLSGLALVQASDVDIPGLDPEWATVAVHIKNFGNTPAIRAQATMTREIWAYPMPDGAEFPKLAEFAPDVSDVPPGCQSENMMDFTISVDQRKMIMEAKAALYVLGRVEYQDTFGTKHSTKFFLYSTGEDFVTGKFRNCAFGNEAT